ncbi:Maf family protein [Pseudoalteromonas sp. CST5]|uniref:Maf family protein n=1 Tax=unclassified Pseudoalteromonas TaxID=194690 RepID=UPI00235816B2|nr:MULTISPECIES: Maf family protein [unclassified Pseudoalteromonas]MDC9514522.1 Maf family protein [Pseudoalteromonas sp. CST1]MDC9539033.1 Maf family protein [Pseudoalteromonas sp. CST3]MDC9541787.1 Maf family protein [Pseudoalteromonas sp. CST2]MDC9547225.1 Maf family protein [Pseudoalteromonas sp. CST4]MDC9550694.1 Maf family protein [Pseudoalteromonas sp. CST5]
MKHPLILASSSPFRQSLLQKFNLPFRTFSPDIDETAIPNETPEQLVKRLSERKARAACDHFVKGLAIGSDQVAVFDGQILGKPHNKENAIKQLSMFSGQTVTFLTGLCVYDIANDKAKTLIEPFEVVFRTLTKEQIEAYCDAEQPYNCAGSFKSEGLGICLFEKLNGDDPNSLIGLPLIKLSQLLAEFNLDILAAQP